VIAAPARTPHVNPTGNAALASPGTGDVLAGWLGGRWAAMHAGHGSREDRAFATALAAVWEHGAAAHATPHGPLPASRLIAALAGLEF
jgi:NAD(P)H-hydrate repair Nnr-like enzyme with NAD(P)H-hydrate dehydratase domain